MEKAREKRQRKGLSVFRRFGIGMDCAKIKESVVILEPAVD